MSGRFRHLCREPIADPERRRLFWLLAAVVIAVAVLLLATRPTPPEAGRVHPVHATRATRSAPPLTLTGPTVSPAPRPSAVPVRAAWAFLAGYLPLLYGQKPHARLVDATSGLSRALTASQLVVPPAQQRLHPRVLSVIATRSGPGWRVRVLVDDGGVADYPIVLTLARVSGGRWLVSGVRG